MTFSTRLPNGNRKICSWGAFYEVTPAFWRGCVAETYGYVSAGFVEATGKTPLNLAPAELIAAMGGFGQRL